jgi:predicted NAD-dependent protein-ADP-ribosyltransferase YbiA (DUF1768 family)
MNVIKSRIHPNVEYTSTRKIFHEDCNTELTVYELQDFGKSFLVALGKPKYKFSTKGIHFVPIYFIPSDNTQSKIQIGVYEFEKDRSIDILDKDGDINVDVLTPLYYPHAESTIQEITSNTNAFLSTINDTNHNANAEDKIEETESETSSDHEDNVLEVSKKPLLKSANTKTKVNQEDDKETKSIFVIDKNFVKPQLLKEETEEDAKETHKKYQGNSDVWVQDFMKSPYYDIHRVESNGDCFFAVIRDGFKSIGYETTVNNLRQILADAMTDDIFQENRRLLLDLKASIREYDQKREKLKQTMIELKNKYRVASTAEREMIRKQSVELLHKGKEYSEKKASIEDIIATTMGDISEIDTLEKYKNYILSSSYWANAWAISTLEKNLNIKMIIFSETSYKDDDLHNVLNCGEIHKDLHQQGYFRPDYFIMTTYSGDHFNLVSYKNKRILTFSEIPYDIKAMIINKCIERNAGAFYMIDDFRSFKMKLGFQSDMGKPDIDSDDEVEVDVQDEENGSLPRRESIDKQDLYDSNIVFRFFGKSEKTPLPGKGTGEVIPNDRIIEYNELKAIPFWRRKLDDSWVQEEPSFKVKGKSYASVEHYVEASKFMFTGAPPQNQDFALLFTLESKNEIAKDLVLCRAAGSKSGKVKASKDDQDGKKPKDIILRPKEVMIDPNFVERQSKERTEALRAKFTQIQEMKKLLMFTKKAKLLHYIAKQPPEVDVQLMETRRRLQRESS